MQRFENKVVVITGGANGLGKALATAFWNSGSHLAIIDTDRAGLEKLQTEFPVKNQKLSIHQADVAEEQQIIAVRKEVISLHHHVDLLINNAGISISLPFERMDLQEYKRLMNVNFWGTVYCSKHFLNDLKARKNSRLVNIISNFALMGFPGKTAYGSSKAAIMGFTNSLRTELEGTTVKVSLVIPPALETDLVKNSGHIDESRKIKEMDFVKKNSMPLGKAAKKIIMQIKKGKHRIIIGRTMFWLDIVLRLFPTFFHNRISRNKKRIDFIQTE